MKELLNQTENKMQVNLLQDEKSPDSIIMRWGGIYVQPQVK